jgi:hypothetical protein
MAVVAGQRSAAEAQVTTLRAALTEIGSGYYLAKDAPKRLDECADLARKALGIEVEPSPPVPSPEEGTAGETQGSRFTEGYVFAIKDAMRVIRSGLIASDRDAQWVAENVQALAYLRRAPSPLPEAPTPPSAEAAGVPVAWEYELASAITQDGRYVNWKKHVAFDPPNAGKGQRNVRALYAAPSPPSEPTALKVTEEMRVAAYKAVANEMVGSPLDGELTLRTKHIINLALDAALMGRKPATTEKRAE